MAVTLRRHLARDEGAALEVAGEVDVAADLEEVGDGAAVDDRHDGALALDVVEREAQAAVGLGVARDGPDDLPGQRDLAAVIREVARLQQLDRAAAEGRVEQEDCEHPGDRESHHEPRRAAGRTGHAVSLAAVRAGFRPGAFPE